MLRLMVGLTVAFVVYWMVDPWSDEVMQCHISDGERPLNFGTCWQTDPAGLVITWTDHPTEASYRVSGSIAYYSRECAAEDTFDFVSSAQFDDILPPDATIYTLPGPDDDSANFVDKADVLVEALSAEGITLATDGMHQINDPLLCPGHELLGEQP
ncbi:MAG: hypothetical protein WD939_05880 [Dehalococcoidia bacterium]